jgi:MFS family permease
MKASPARILGASLVGTAVEFYDFYIYATAASLVFGPLFFPSESKSLQLLAAYASFGVAFLARPVGAMAFGHFGDRIGRKSTLVASLMLMGGSTIAIAFLPTYAMIGWVAPLLLCVLRFGQGFGLGGEWGGAALLAVENAPPGWRARYGMFPQLGAPVGLHRRQRPVPAARALVDAGGVSRMGLAATVPGERDPGRARALGAAQDHRDAGLRGSARAGPAARGAARGSGARSQARAVRGNVRGDRVLCDLLSRDGFALGYGTTTLGYDRTEFLGVQLIAILFMAGGILASGWLSDRGNPRHVLMAGCVAAIATGGLLAPMMGSGSLFQIGLFLSLALWVMGFVYGPLGAWLPGLFPARVRYTGVSIAFNTGGILGGALAPIVAQALSESGGLFYVGLYLAAAAGASFVALALIRR